ncbi:MAG: hypothetical protein Q9169_007461 [Polycauliona sp. 2 TL-2023]
MGNGAPSTYAPEVDHPHRFDNDTSSTYAPEVDHTGLAPAWRADNCLPQVVPEEAKQVLYDNSPPEVVASAIEKQYEEPGLHSIDQTPQHRCRRRPIVIVIAIIVICCLVALGIGLGVGLSRRAKRDDVVVSNSSTTSVLAAPAHGMIDNGSIAAFTLYTGDSHVYFQENSGAIRRALYSHDADKWGAPVDSRLVANAKMSTPLAAVPFFTDTLLTQLRPVVLFYVKSADSTIGCIEWTNGSNPDDCSQTWDLPRLTVTPDSPRIVASPMSEDGDQLIVMLVYQDPSRGLVILSRAVDAPESNGTNGTSDWAWRDETEVFNSVLRMTGRNASSTRSFLMKCFTESESTTAKPRSGSTVSFEFNVNRTSLYNVTLSGTYRPDEYVDLSGSLDIVLEYSHSLRAYFEIWFRQSTFQSDDLPAPRSGFPFERIAGTINQKPFRTQLYHQLDSSTIVEDVWGAVDNTWSSTNISIGMT